MKTKNLHPHLPQVPPPFPFSTSPPLRVLVHDQHQELSHRLAAAATTILSTTP